MKPMKIIVIGCGRIGAGLAQAMSLQGHAVTVVDPDLAAFERLGRGFKGEVVQGVGFDRDVLLRAGIERADGLAAVTSSDETNVVAARIAREVFHVPRVIAQLYDPRKAEIYRRLGLQTVTPTTWGINRISDLLSYSGLDVILSLGSGEVDVVEAEVPPHIVGRTVSDVTIAGEIIVAAITRKGRSFLPTLGAVFEKDDRLHFILSATSADRLRELLELT
jgi:trk system potassium uptake protein TrkA